MNRNGFPRVAAGLAFLAIGFAAAGCATKPSAAVPPPAAKAATAEDLHAGLREVRQHAWLTALEITDVYERIPAEKCPGVAALVRDIRAAQAEVDRSGLDSLRPDQLVTNNPHFWRAALEIASTDGSFLLLHATLLASGGDLWRANRILVATTQLLPIPRQLRAFYLAHTYGVGTFLLNEMAAAETTTGPHRLDALQRALKVWPNNAGILAELLDERIRSRVTIESAGLRKPNREQLGQMVDQVLHDSRGDVERLFALDPVGGAAYRGNEESRKEGRNLRALWMRMSDSDVALSHKEVGELAVDLEKVGGYELALVLQRLQVSSRGFPAPGDEAFWRRVVTKLLGPTEGAKFWADIDKRGVNVVELNQTNTEESWQGDPAVNPLVMQAVDREIAEHSFEIDILHGNPEAQAQAYRARGIQEGRAGLNQAAIEDFDTAMRLTSRSPLLLVDKAVALAALGKEEEAQRLFDEVRSTEAGREVSIHEYGIFKYGQGRFQEAREAFAEEFRRHRDEPYAAIMAELSARRLGDAKPGIAARAQKPRSGDPWPGHCLQYLAGRIGEDELLKVAHQGGNLTMIEHLCEANFIMSQTSLASGDTARGLDLLESCIRTGVTGFVEFQMARVELRRLAPEREARTRNVEEPVSRQPAEKHDRPHLQDKKPAEEELLDDAVPA